MRVSLPKGRYDTVGKSLSFVDRALQQIRTLPGVESAGVIDDLPVLGGSVQPIVLEGQPELLPRDQPTVGVRKISNSRTSPSGAASRLSCAPDYRRYRSRPRRQP